MCGIAGIFAYRDSAPPVDRDELLCIREAMIKRGPDGAGLWISADQRTGLAHRRLTIIDLTDAGAQPMATADGRFRITFNGEIYNYRELRKELEAKGCRFHSNSDTEVLLQLYADRGEDMVHALRGMYAFAIWNEDKKGLFLARDPFGVKPLYYSDDGKTMRFASQVKALLKGGAVDTAPEPAGSVGFLVWGHVPEPYTLYRGIRSLPAGTYLRMSFGGSASITPFFSIREEFLKAEESTRIAVTNSGQILREALVDSVQHHLVSDVPVGLFLSSGLDSSTLAGLAAEQSNTALKAITLGFPEYRGTKNDEVPLAAMTAERFGISHSAQWTGHEDFESEMERIIEAMDQPSTDGVNTYLISRAAARAGMKVAISGLGGDEYFGGYPSFWQVPRAAMGLGFARIAPTIGQLVRWVLAPFTGQLISPKYAGLLEYGGTYGGAYLLRRALFMPWELKSMLDPATVQMGLERLQIVENLNAAILGLRRPRPRISTLELGWYMRNQLLRDADWAGMAHSLEIRVPLVDVQLFRALAPLLVSKSLPTKLDLAGVLRNALPQSVLLREKTGFSTPVREWISAASGSAPSARGLRGWAQRVLPPQPRMFRALALVTDAFGGAGGIAKFNRDLLTTLALMPECAEVVVIPRLILSPIGPVPPRIKFIAKAQPAQAAGIAAAVTQSVPTSAVAVAQAVAAGAPPAQAAGIAAAVSMVAPTSAANVAAAVARAQPAQAAGIAAAVTQVAPTSAVAIAQSVVTAVPAQALQIAAAMAKAAPTQTASIATAIATANAKAPTATGTSSAQIAAAMTNTTLTGAAATANQTALANAVGVTQAAVNTASQSTVVTNAQTAATVQVQAAQVQVQVAQAQVVAAAPQVVVAQQVVAAAPVRTAGCTGSPC